MDNRETFFAVLIAALVILAGVFVWQASRTTVDFDVLEQNTLKVSDTAYEWEFSEADLQLPELPTGCEATACATLARMCGIPLSKTQVADMMEWSIAGENFVEYFWGNPYSENGWACMPPCAVNALNKLLERYNYAAFELKDVALEELELPCAAWVTIGYEDVRWSKYEQDGYRLAHNPHAVVVMKISNEYVTVCDPLIGVREVERATFERVYNDMGQMAVVVKDWS